MRTSSDVIYSSWDILVIPTVRYAELGISTFPVFTNPPPFPGTVRPPSAIFPFSGTSSVIPPRHDRRSFRFVPGEISLVPRILFHIRNFSYRLQKHVYRLLSRASRGFPLQVFTRQSSFFHISLPSFSISFEASRTISGWWAKNVECKLSPSFPIIPYEEIPVLASLAVVLASIHYDPS